MFRSLHILNGWKHLSVSSPVSTHIFSPLVVRYSRKLCWKKTKLMSRTSGGLITLFMIFFLLSKTREFRPLSGKLPSSWHWGGIINTTPLVCMCWPWVIVLSGLPWICLDKGPYRRAHILTLLFIPL